MRTPLFNFWNDLEERSSGEQALINFDECSTTVPLCDYNDNVEVVEESPVAVVAVDGFGIRRLATIKERVLARATPSTSTEVLPEVTPSTIFEF